MKRACIIIPHIDDDIYSCWSILSDKSYDEIVIVKVTQGAHQLNREAIHNLLMTDPDRYGLNHNIRIEWLFGNREESPEDGNAQSIPDFEYVTRFDKYTSQDFTEFYYPSMSHHQDHVLVNRACLAALRARSSMRLKNAYEYTYMYNYDTERAVCYKPLNGDELDYKLKCLKDMNDFDSILDEYSVNSLDYVERSNRNFGTECNQFAAEKFILVFGMISYYE